MLLEGELKKASHAEAFAYVYFPSLNREGGFDVGP